MSFQPVTVSREKPDHTVFFISVSVSGQLRLGINVRHVVEDLDHTHLEVQYDAVTQKLRFRSGNVGIRLRYNVVSITKDVARPFTYIRGLGVYRTRRHVVELNEDGWCYITKSPKRWRDELGVGKNQKHT